MANVSVQNVLAGVQADISGGGPRFESKFLSSLNASIADFNSHCGTSLGEVTQLDATIAVASLRHTRTFVEGCIYYMARSGEWIKDMDVPKQRQIYREQMGLSQSDIYQDSVAGIPEGDWGTTDDEEN